MSPLSLQSHLVSLRPQSSAVLVDPRGFKTALQSLTKFLIAHQIPATLWLKLPKDDVWWKDIWQYAQQAAGCTIYTLGEQIATPPDNLAASLRSIAIEQDAELKREYLCLAIADNFVGTLLAARVPSGLPTPDKRNLKLYCSTSGHTVAALAGGLRAIIESGLSVDSVDSQPSAKNTDSVAAQLAPDLAPNLAPDLTADLAASDLAPDLAAAEATTDNIGDDIGDGIDGSLDSSAPLLSDQQLASKAVLSQWERCFPASLTSQETLPYTDAFLTWQLQFQEDLRSQISTYRTATTATKDDASRDLYALSPDFLAQASQELQSPLTTIKTALTLLGAPTLKMAQRQRYLEMISAQCDRQKSLITSVIDLLQMQTAATAVPQPLQLADMIPGIVSTYQPIAEERGIMLAYTVPPNLAQILGVGAELKQVVIHLIQNGIQTTPQGGRVWVAAAPHDASFIALTVQDSGAGITKTDSDRLFEAFYRGAGSGEAGSGLELALVQQLVRRMGGSVSVESAPNKGTTFKILLPVCQINAQINAQMSPPGNTQVNSQVSPQMSTAPAAVFATGSMAALR
jgi:two-component system, OmpR family, phosphate regulon sensor histidine kinase PhoR